MYGISQMTEEIEIVSKAKSLRDQILSLNTEISKNEFRGRDELVLISNDLIDSIKYLNSAVETLVNCGNERMASNKRSIIKSLDNLMEE